ncbi:hypothetical protein SETIT_9G300700v2 [Setaria italica]|uniref:BHLH domain-containing protein n=1 Tax=Setaria italica TaxID=4555 RepID=A0A368SME0_SETIT|nr:transcription factor bHLH19-like [Setaria italica]XP_022685342.1 transcription factor bHLH19-like [Setaria italica]RCV43524.1 hypothetical protein SETIT_9G300700v2 [Setaria italica]
MNSSLDHQWLEELENEDLRELDFIDPLSIHQLAESMANELWEQPSQEQQVELDQRQQRSYPAAFSVLGDDINKSYPKGFPTAITAGGGDDSMFSFVDGNSKQLSFSAREHKQEGNTSSLTMTKETKGGRRASSSVPEHVISERKRREKMHLQFATLASIIPDVTKTDKVSLLGSAIDYVHHLRGRLKALQEEHHRSTGSTAESPPLDARCCIGFEDDGEASPKIEADVRGRTVMLRVVCREKKGVLIMVLKELEKHGLTIINTNVLPLSESSSLNITVTAQIEDGSSTAVDLVNNLNSALKKF